MLGIVILALNRHLCINIVVAFNVFELGLQTCSRAAISHRVRLGYLHTSPQHIESTAEEGPHHLGLDSVVT